ncbi:ribbon-helix-helix domain-containing protein [Skermania sp. ID1734]|uniref:ribbon-helix-helix domain-containing protein n=1 Tax=Skermania sp. ID1734 TaxID=2597516 RepID=UPI00117FDE47|nr:ribbon-helix-helix domain-containing protein [Skermania sp. ID1734]TSD94812.1 ribbon-helix-helix domain-containing protein [Skermania sp. ID1734]
MAQHSKGPRKQIQPRLRTEVYAAIDEIAKRQGTSVSQYVADLCAVHVGRPDLVWISPNREQQELFPDDHRKVS